MEKFPDYHYFGNQGPDLFFFNLKMLGKNNPGTEIHDRYGSDFIKTVEETVINYGEDSEVFAYFLGCICHYILDSNIHPSVDRIETPDYTHMEMETELDRYFIYRDNISLKNHNREEIIPTGENLKRTVTALYENYEDIDYNMVKDSINGFYFVEKLLNNKSPLKEKFLLGVFKLAGMKSYIGQILTSTPRKKAEGVNKILLEDYYRGLKIAPRLTLEVYKYLFKGGEIPEEFNLNYNGVKNV